MRRFRALLCAAIVSLSAGACGDGEVAVPDLPGDAAAGAVVYEQGCAGCHGDDGSGADAGPGLLVPEYSLPGFDDTALVTAIVKGVAADEGRYGGMPRIRGLSEQDLADLIAFVRGLQHEAGAG